MYSRCLSIFTSCGNEVAIFPHACKTKLCVFPSLKIDRGNIAKGTANLGVQCLNSIEQRRLCQKTVKRKDKTLNTDVWLQLLKTQTTASCGALYNEMDKEFFILGPDQVDLVNSGFHEMMRPKTVEGAAGTGKTISEF